MAFAEVVCWPGKPKRQMKLAARQNIFLFLQVPDSSSTHLSENCLQ